MGFYYTSLDSKLSNGAFFFLKIEKKRKEYDYFLKQPLFLNFCVQYFLFLFDILNITKATVP